MAFASGKHGIQPRMGLENLLRRRSYHRQALAIFEKTDNHTGKGYALVE